MAPLLISAVRSLLPTRWLPPNLLPTSANEASTSSLLLAKTAGPPRKSSSIRSAEELDLAQNGGTFPAFPFPALGRAVGGRRDSGVELELDNGQQLKQRWSVRRMANAVYVVVFWLLVICWLRALCGYGYDADAVGWAVR
jgi:hypothetical protein